jgi:hypothetical protein
MKNQWQKFSASMEMVLTSSVESFCSSPEKRAKKYPNVEAVWRDFKRHCRKTVQQNPGLGARNARWEKNGIQETAFWKFSRCQEFASLLADRLAVHAKSARAEQIDTEISFLITAMVEDTVTRWAPPIPKENKGNYRRRERRNHLDEMAVKSSIIAPPHEKSVTFASSSECRFYGYTEVDYEDSIGSSDYYVETKPSDGRWASPPNAISQDLVAAYGSPGEFVAREGFEWDNYLDYNNELLSRHAWWIEAENDLIAAFRASANQPFLESPYLAEHILHYLGSHSLAWKPCDRNEQISPLGFLAQHVFKMFTEIEFDQIRRLGVDSGADADEAEVSIRYLSYAVIAELRQHFGPESGTTAGRSSELPPQERNPSMPKKKIQRRQLRDKVISTHREELQANIYRDYGYGRVPSKAPRPIGNEG